MSITYQGLSARGRASGGSEVAMLKTSLITFVTFALLTVSQSALAQQLPNAGGQIQQIPPPPVLQKSIPDIRIEQREAQPGPASVGEKVLVKSLHVTGATKFSEAELISAADFKPGSELDLAGLRALAAKISDYYNSRGYFVAQAYLPAQDISEGAITIAVIEGRYGKVTLHNETNVSDDLPNNVLEGLDGGEVVATAPLERRLLLLSDIPGVEVKSTLAPGSEVGTSDLTVDVTPGRRVTGSLEADNAGNPYTGAYRVGGTVNFNEPLGYGDVATLRALSSTTGGLNYVRGSYQAQLYDATVGIAYSGLWYRLGRQFSGLDARGTANIASVYGSYPLIRSRSNNLYALLDFDARTFQDKTGVPPTVSDREARVLIAGLYGDHSDTFGGGGFSSFSLNWSFGNLDIQTPAVMAADAASARSNGSYNKLGFDAARLQTVTDRLSLYVDVRGQIASKNLDTSEKMELGGAYAVRAYPEGESFGDQGYVATLEARFLLPKLSERLPGEMHLIGFIDTGTITVNETPWTTGPNRRTLSGAGIGLTWADYNNFVFKAYYARKLGDEVAISAPDSPGRVWVQIVKFL